jgi:cytochrome c-type biogenesis protein CcmH/NrfG
LAQPHTILTSLVRHPVSFAILVLSVVILIVWFDYKSTYKSSSMVSAVEQNGPAAMPDNGPTKPIRLAPPGSQPSIMDQAQPAMGDQQQTSAPAIDALLGGLEAKVKAEPGNLDNRILLAQTYKELGRAPDALTELRSIHQQQPDNPRANLVLASILSQSSDPKELDEALELLANIKDDMTVQPYLIHLYKGDALIRKQNHQGALENWKQALATMPESDARYAVLEKKVLDLTSGAPADMQPGT